MNIPPLSWDSFTQNFYMALDLTKPSGDSQIDQAVRYGLDTRGKALRPYLIYLSAYLGDIEFEQSVFSGIAAEYLHTYSLIHDDLPCMDDADLRRGADTIHKKYDEATAVLVGDALLTHAFEFFAHENCHKNALIRCEMITLVVGHLGIQGMIGGQSLDIKFKTTDPSDQQLAGMHRKKTAEFLKLCCLLGGKLWNAPSDKLQNLGQFGLILGEVFQLTDDILDITQNAETTGKTTDQDLNNNMAKRLGIDQTRRIVDEKCRLVEKILSPFNGKADSLIDLTTDLQTRIR